MLRLSSIVVFLSVGVAGITAAGLASGEEDARTRQLRLLCARLSGDLTEPGGIAAFHRCLTREPLGEIRRDNNIAAPPPDGPSTLPSAGYGRNGR